jgi:hypothetical protein
MLCSREKKAMVAFSRRSSSILSLFTKAEVDQPDAYAQTSAGICGRFCLACDDGVFEAVGFADSHAGAPGATYHRIHDGFWHR